MVHAEHVTVCRSSMVVRWARTRHGPAAGTGRSPTRPSRPAGRRDRGGSSSSTAVTPRPRRGSPSRRPRPVPPPRRRAAHGGRADGPPRTTARRTRGAHQPDDVEVPLAGGWAKPLPVRVVATPGSPRLLADPGPPQDVGVAGLVEEGFQVGGSVGDDRRRDGGEHRLVDPPRVVVGAQQERRDRCQQHRAAHPRRPVRAEVADDLADAHREPDQAHRTQSIAARSSDGSRSSSTDPEEHRPGPDLSAANGTSAARRPRRPAGQPDGRATAPVARRRLFATTWCGPRPRSGRRPPSTPGTRNRRARIRSLQLPFLRRVLASTRR